MKIIKLLSIAIMIASSTANAQNTNFLEKLKGAWQANGTAFGMPADVNMEWMAVLGGRFTQIQYKILMHGKDGKSQQFEGTAYYKPSGDNQYWATWFDTNGEMHPITASSNESTLTSLWGTPETKMGKTLYKLLDDKTVEVTDYIQKKDGSWQQFGKNTLIKK